MLTGDDLAPELMKYLNPGYRKQKEREAYEISPSPVKAMSAAERYAAAGAAAKEGYLAAATSATSSDVGVGGFVPLAKREDEELDEFVTTLKTQVEIFVNRMKSNSSRGRSIATDSSVQTLFMNTMAMHSQLLRHIQAQEDKRVYYEGLQDKITQVRIVTKPIAYC